jgi:hypothetical protein
MALGYIEEGPEERRIASEPWREEAWSSPENLISNTLQGKEVNVN